LTHFNIWVFNEFLFGYTNFLIEFIDAAFNHFRNNFFWFTFIKSLLSKNLTFVI